MTETREMTGMNHITQMPNKVIQLWDVDKLVPYGPNAKKHPDDQVRKLATAIKKFGWTQPIIIWTDGSIIAGHGRRLAAIMLGMKKVPVIIRDDLTKAEADALRLSDNRVTSTEYDQAEIQRELQRLVAELGGSEISIEDIGFDEKELSFSLADLGEINDDFFVDDVSAAVEKQAEENKETVKSTDETAAPVGDALGFKRISIAQSRELRGYVTKIEAKTGKTGIEAILTFIGTKLES